MSTLRVIPYTTETDWKERRLTGIGSSECAAMLGKSPWMSREELFLAKIGRHTPKFDSKTLARFAAGNDLEGAVAVRACRDYPHIATGKILHDPQRAIQARQFGDRDAFWLTCTVDRLLVPELHGLFDPHLVPSAYPSYHLVEVKSSSRGSEEIPEQYLYQVQHQLLVTGSSKAHLVSMAIEGTAKWDKLSKAQVLEYFAGASIKHWEILHDRSMQEEILQGAERLCREIKSHQ